MQLPTANHLPVRHCLRYLRDGNHWAHAASHSHYWLWCNRWEVTDYPPTVPVWCPMISTSFDPLWSIWLASECNRCLQEESIYTIGIDFFYTGIKALVPFGTTAY